MDKLLKNGYSEDRFSRSELEGAQKAILSTIRKSEKVKETLSQKEPPRTAQITLVSLRLKTFYLASSLISSALNEDLSQNYIKGELEEALHIIPPLVDQIEKMKTKFKEGTPQYTLAVRRIDAFRIALALLTHRLRLETSDLPPETCDLIPNP